VRWEQAKQALAEVSNWSGRILVDATNRPLEEGTKGKAASEIIASMPPVLAYFTAQKALPLFKDGGSIILTSSVANIDFPSCDVFHLENGKIKSFHCYNEASLMLQQLGVGPS
jgi:hypothetical protein